MLMIILLGIYLGSIALFAFVVFCGMRAAFRQAKELSESGYTFKKERKNASVAFLRLVLVGLTPIINTFCAVFLLWDYERFEYKMVMVVNRMMKKKEA